MSWHQFRYIFSRDVENAMRYSVHEALRKFAKVSGPQVQIVADEAIESFKRKMDKFAPKAGDA